jgi:hypothetical protein
MTMALSPSAAAQRRTVAQQKGWDRTMTLTPTVVERWNSRANRPGAHATTRARAYVVNKLSRNGQDAIRVSHSRTKKGEDWFLVQIADPAHPRTFSKGLFLTAGTRKVTAKTPVVPTSRSGLERFLIDGVAGSNWGGKRGVLQGFRTNPR